MHFLIKAKPKYFALWFKILSNIDIVNIKINGVGNLRLTLQFI